MATDFSVSLKNIIQELNHLIKTVVVGFILLDGSKRHIYIRLGQCDTVILAVLLHLIYRKPTLLSGVPQHLDRWDVEQDVGVDGDSAINSVCPE